MRLVNAKTLLLEEFSDNQIPEYAILSHTWSNEEISFQEMMGSPDQGKDGFKKIVRCCKQALFDGISHVWVDTCCIDKSSSAELSEAINSMFRWYGNAKTCYAYLSDLDVSTYVSRRMAAGKYASVLVSLHPETPSSFELPLNDCRWFTRGWTLQELIAPRDVSFFDRNWHFCGTKSNLATQLCKITGVDQDALLSRKSLASFSIAKRMSWASKRETTRTEDLAYCLLGIFGINMPLLYGEGSKAFIRLQEEIVKESDDQSLFAWEAYIEPVGQEYEAIDEINLRGPFATAPAEFSHSGDIVPLRAWETSEPYTMTNKGLRLSIPLKASSTHKGRQEFLGILACRREGPVPYPLGIPLVEVGGGEDSTQFSRVATKRLQTITLDYLRENISSKQQNQTVPIYMRKQPVVVQTFDKLGVGFELYSLLDHFSVVDVWPESLRSKKLKQSSVGLIWSADLENFKSNGRGLVLLFRNNRWKYGQIGRELRQFVFILGCSTDAEQRPKAWYSVEERNPNISLNDHWAQVSNHHSRQNLKAIKFKCQEYIIHIKMQEVKTIIATIYTIEFSHHAMHGESGSQDSRSFRGMFGRSLIRNLFSNRTRPKTQEKTGPTNGTPFNTLTLSNNRRPGQSPLTTLPEEALLEICLHLTPAEHVILKCLCSHLFERLPWPVVVEDEEHHQSPNMKTTKDIIENTLRARC